VEQATVLATSLIGCTLVLLAGAWRVRWPRPLVVLGLGLFVAATLLAAPEDSHPGDIAEGWATTILCLTGALAVIGGGPVTAMVFDLVDGRATEVPGSMDRAGEILRGGAWIGVLERAAIFGAIVSGWPEGLALVLALKGLGRYPELRNQEHTGIAERFIIGSFSSALWATGCAGGAALLLN